MSEIHKDLASFKNPRLVEQDDKVLVIRDDDRFGDLTSWPNAVPEEFIQTKNPFYSLGVPSGSASGAFGLYMPNIRSTQEVQAAYRQDAETIRQMPRQIHHD